MSTLRLDSAHLQAMSAHAVRVYPEECCGLLLGWGNPVEASKTVAEVWATENAWTPEIETSPESGFTKQRRYWIDPAEMLQAMKSGRERGLEIIGIYHSHPDAAAVPSECDRVAAWPQYSYLILSVQQGQVDDVKSWQLDETQQFQPEVLVMAPEAEMKGDR